MAHIHIDGISAAFDDLGNGTDQSPATRMERVLLLIHGHPFDRSMWRPQAEAAAAAGWRVIVPDLRGYGETTVVSGKTTLDVFANDLAALLDRLGVNRAVVGGLSMGGQIAMEFARLHPNRVQGLLLAATFARTDTDTIQRYRHELADRLEHEGMARLADELLPKMLAPQSIQDGPQLAAMVHAMMQRAPALGAAAALRGRAERRSYEPVLAALMIPALIIVGDQDAFTSRDDAEQMQKLLSRGRLVWMHGVGHMPNLERPREFNDALLAFLKQFSTGSTLQTADA